MELELPSKLQSVFPHETPRSGTSSVPYATFNFINAILGAGILGTPYAISQSGLGLGLALLFVVVFFVHVGLSVIIQCGVLCHVSSYQALGHHVYGEKGFVLVSLMTVFSTFGSMLAFMMVMKDNLDHLARDAPDVFFLPSHVMLLVFATVCILPLCLLRDLSRLAPTSALSVLLCLSLIGILVASAPGEVRRQDLALLLTDDPEVPSSSRSWTWFKPSFAALGALSFSVAGTKHAFVIFHSLKRPTLGNWASVTFRGLVVVSSGVIVMGVAGYVNFQQHTRPDILNNFRDHDTPLVICARVLVCLSMILTFPVEMFVLRQALVDLLCFKSTTTTMGNSQHSNSVYPTNSMHVGITLCCWALALALGLALENIGVVLELTGAIATSMLAFILPGAIFFQVQHSSYVTFRRRWPNLSMTERVMEGWPFFLALLLQGFGLTVMICGSLQVILDVYA